MIISVHDDAIASQFVQVMDQGTKHSLQSKILRGASWTSKNVFLDAFKSVFIVGPSRPNILREGNT